MKNQKRALLYSVISLLLSVTMLMGTTYAWFTDSVSSVSNIITAGNLDVEMYYTDDLESGNWKDASDCAVFNYDNWEPGYTEVRYIKIVNAGSLAFRYRMSITPRGRVGKLAEVIDLYYLEKPTANIQGRAALAALTPVSTLRDALISHRSTDGVLLPAGEQSANYDAGEIIVAVAMKMQEDAGNEYQNESIGDGFAIQLVATQFAYESDSFGNNYDDNATFPELNLPAEIQASVTPTADGKVPVGGVQMQNKDGSVKVTVPAGAALKPGTTKLTATVKELDESDANIVLGDNEILRSLDVHVEGLAEGNTVPALITIEKALLTGLNLGNYQLYHVENGASVPMVLVTDTPDAHNEFTYDPATGDVTLAMATFSEVAAVADTENAWNGTFDYTWYNADATELQIANADQLAAFGAIVGGMDGQTQDSFSGKTVKLISDINLGDKESENNSDIIFYPIGYYNSDGTYEKTNTAITSGFYTFEGTFDGNGHTIANFYQNTWEMKGDHNWYDATLQYYRDGMGLFGKVYGGTVKNLTVDNFSSDGEIATTGVIAAYADGATFENIAITNCNPRVYNIGNGGIVGCVGWYAKEAGMTTTFKNITVDNSNKISALWGSYDVACGGIVGQYYPESGQSSANYPANAGIEFVNCHVAAQMDVYNDVCANYQYYAYRYTGMLIGSVRENLPADENGHVYPNMDGITAESCTVHFGTWNDYYYCEIIDNTTASYTHDYQMSRLTEIKAIDGTTITYLDGTTGTVPASGRANYVIVDYTKGHGTDNATCYHFKDGAVWNHEDAGEETVNGETVLKEDKQHIYLEFNNLVTGYGWGVTSRGLSNLDGVTNLDITAGDHEASVEKFESTVTELSNNATINLGDIFNFVDNGVKLVPGALTVTVTNLDENNPVSATIVYDRTNWENGTITFTGVGEVQITIQDYYFCTPTTITVNVTERQNEEKFDVVMNNGDFLHRVGNSGTVALDKLFKAKDGVTVGTVSVTVEAVDGTGASGTYSNNAIQFSGTGVVKVTITDNAYCTPTVLYLEVVDALNATSATSATSNNVVLLNNTSGTFTVSNGYTFYGNGFTVTLPTTVQSKYSAGYVGYVTLTNGNLDNIRIEGPNYPEMYIYRDQAQDSTDTTKVNYFYNSILINGGNCTISNSYISGSRTAVCIRGANNAVIDNTTIAGGSYANMQIAGGSSVTLRDLTTVQVDVADSYGKGKTVHGLGIAVDSAVTDIYIEGELNQYNWLCEEQWNSIVPSTYQSSFPKFFTDSKFDKYWHYLNGGTASYVNMAFIFACNWDTSKIHDNRTTVDYGTTDATIANVVGGVYSKINTVGGIAITDANLADPGYVSPGFNPVAPKLNFDNTANNDADDESDANDTYCVYDESTCTLKIGVSGDSKTLDLSGVTVTKNGTTLDYTAYLNGTQISGNSVTIKAADGTKQTLTFKATSNDAGYDKDGNPIAGSIEYTWTVTVEIATLSYPAPVWNMGGNYQFDKTNLCYVYYSKNQGYGEAVPIYEGIKVTYYNKSGTLVNLDLSGTKTLPTGSNNSNSNAFTYTLSDGSTLTMKFSSGWKSGATTHQFTTYSNKVYIYPQSLDNDNYVRANTTNQDFDVKITYTFTDPNGQSTETVTMRWYNAAASNGDVITVQWKSFDSTNGKEVSTCLTEGTLITLADGTQKPVEELKLGDMVLAFNHETGKFVATPVIFNSHVDDLEPREYDVLHLEFSNGEELKIVESHGLFDMNLMKYVYVSNENYAEFIGHKFYYAGKDGTASEHVTLVNAYVEKEVTRVFCPVTYFNMNSIANGFLNAPNSPYGIAGPVNYFDYDPDLKYNEEKMQADIEKYGLYTYDDFKDYISEEAYNSSTAVYLKVAEGKGLITFEEILIVINYLLEGSLIK